MREDTIAVIIPVWNTPAWMLEKCVRSVEAQTHPLQQILLMDDGSSAAETLECLERLAGESTAVELAHLPHGGISAARNAGLERVRSAWFLFLDSDDFWEPGFVAGLLWAAEEKTQIVFCGYQVVDYSGRNVISRSPDKALLLDPARSPYFTCGTGSRLWNTAFVQRLGRAGSFPLHCIMEDELFSAFVIAAAENIVCVEQYGYNVRSREDSTCRSRASFNKSNVAQMPLEAMREGLSTVQPAGEWQKQVLHCRCLHSMMAASWIFCCYAAPAERRIVARQAADLVRECLPDYTQIAENPAMQRLYAPVHRAALRVYAFAVSHHMEYAVQVLCVTAMRLYYKMAK